MPTAAGQSEVLFPIVAWAQRKEVLFITISVEDCKKPQIEITSEKLHFKGRAGSGKDFECTINFYNEVDAEKARRIPGDRNIQYVIPKKEPGPFWPRLLKESAKVHWVKVDFQKWKDEDESDNEWGGGGAGAGAGAGGDFESMMQGLGGGYGGGKDFDDFEDSDEEGLPDLEDDVKQETSAAEPPGAKEDEEMEKKQPSQSVTQ